jgi:hypothetical protein
MAVGRRLKGARETSALHVCVALCLLLLASAGACKQASQSRTTIPGAWRNTDFSGEPFTSFFVIGIGRNDEYRRLYEDSMVRALTAQGAAARASYESFPETEKLDRARVLVAIEQAGYDAVVIARLDSVNEQQVYVPARPKTSSDEYMGGYDEKYAVNSEPAHYEKRTTYRVETSVYSIHEALLAWVAYSDTVDPESVEELIGAVSTNLARRMKADGLIRDPQ